MDNVKTERISYSELERRLGDVLLCNKIWESDEELYENLYNGSTDYCYKHETSEECAAHDEDCEYETTDTYQSFLISESDAEYLRDHTDEIVHYSPLLELYVWSVTHWGTAWNGVYLDFKETE